MNRGRLKGLILEINYDLMGEVLLFVCLVYFFMGKNVITRGHPRAGTFCHSSGYRQKVVYGLEGGKLSEPQRKSGSCLG